MTDLKEAREWRDELQKSLDTLRRLNIPSGLPYTSKTVLVLTSLIDRVERVEELEGALRLAEDVLSTSSRFTTRFWVKSDGSTIHPQTGIHILRQALKEGGDTE